MPFANAWRASERAPAREPRKTEIFGRAGQRERIAEILAENIRHHTQEGVLRL